MTFLINDTGAIRYLYKEKKLGPPPYKNEFVTDHRSKYKRLNTKTSTEKYKRISLWT